MYDQEVTHSLLFGQDNMQPMGMFLSYAPQEYRKAPKVKISKPMMSYLETRYKFPSEISTCAATVSLAPHETKTMVFEAHPLSYNKETI